MLVFLVLVYPLQSVWMSAQLWVVEERIRDRMIDDQARMKHFHWTRANSSVRGVKPNRECFLASSSLCLPLKLAFFPSLFIASLPLIFLHRSFSALLSHSPLLFAEVMTELPWHMLPGWTSRASKHTPALMHSHTDDICWMDYCRVTIPTRANEMVMENKVRSQTNGPQNPFFSKSTAVYRLVKNIC